MRIAPVLALLAPVLASAEVLVVSHQGYVVDLDDLPLNGQITVKLTLYPRSDAGPGEKIWDDTFTTTAWKGFYTLLLGDTRALKRELTAADLAGERWIGVELNGGGEMIPRLRFGSVPTALHAGHAEVAEKALALDAAVTLPAGKVTGLAAVATSGGYDDLSGKPALADVATSGDYGDLTGKPALANVATSGDYGDLTGKPALANVATSGAYTDLVNKPALAPVATSGDYGDLTGKPALAPVAASGAYTDLTGRPTLAPVATSGAYADLGGRPDLTGYAPLAGPTFTGTATFGGALVIPTASAGACPGTGNALKGALWFDATQAVLYGCAASGWVPVGGAPAGSTRERALASCKAIKDTGSGGADGTYWIDPNGGTTGDAFQAYCDMTSTDGPWTLVVRIKKADGQAHWNSGAVGAGQVRFQGPSTEKFSDAVVNQIRAAGGYSGTTQYKFTCFENSTSDAGCGVTVMFCSSACTFNAIDSTNGNACSLCSKTFQGSMTQLTPNTGTRGMGHHHLDLNWFAYQRHPEQGTNSGCRSDSCGGGDGHLWVR